MPSTQPTEQNIFEQKFGDMAYQQLSENFPDLMDSAIQFQVLDSDLDTNSATGAFIMEVEGNLIYVPVVMSENSLSDYDIMYVKDRDIFVPFTEQWLSRMRPMGEAPMAEATKIPPVVPHDVDIRNLVIPPTSGRFAFASVKEEAIGGTAKFIDNLINNAIEGSLVGGGAATLSAASDKDLRDVPGAAVRGALGGAMVAPMARAFGKAVGNRYDLLTPEFGGDLGALLGAVGGGIAMERGTPTSAAEYLPGQSSNAGHSFAPLIGAAIGTQIASAQNPYGGRVATAGLIDMVSKIAEGPVHKQKSFIQFAAESNNAVKEACVRMLDQHPEMLKMALDNYGAETLRKALKKQEDTPDCDINKVKMLTPKSGADEFKDVFGKKASAAYSGALKRGYAYKDDRPNLKFAYSVESDIQFEQIKSPGAYEIYMSDGTARNGCVAVDLIEISKTRYGGLQGYTGDRFWTDVHPETDRLVMFENGDYVCCSKVYGREVSPYTYKGSSDVYKAIYGDGVELRPGLGVFVSTHNNHKCATYPVVISEIRTDANGVKRFRIEDVDAADMRKRREARKKDGDDTSWLDDDIRRNTQMGAIDPNGTHSTKIIHPKNSRNVIIPPNFKWVPLKNKIYSDDLIRDPHVLIENAEIQARDNSTDKIVVRHAGADRYAIDNGGQLSKTVAMKKIAEDKQIHMSAAEALLKIAKYQDIAFAYITPLGALVKTANPMMGGAPMAPPPAPAPAGGAPAQDPNTMAADPAMMQQPPMMDPNMMAMMQEMAMMQAQPSAIDQAFGEVTGGLEQQLQQIQGQLDVLALVQNRANELEGVPAAEEAQWQGMEGQDPMYADPSMGMAPEEEMPRGAVMTSDTPQGSIMDAQINPQFLQDAQALEQLGAFDAGAIATMAQNSQHPLTKDDKDGLMATMDNLSRALLSARMEEARLREEIGDEAFDRFIEKLERTLETMGDTVLLLEQHSTALTPEDA